MKGDAGRTFEYPGTSISLFSPLPVNGEQYPVPFMENHAAVKLYEDEESVKVGLAHPEERALRERLIAFHRKPVEFFRIDSSELSQLLARLSSGESLTESGVSGPEASAAAGGDERLYLDRIANDAPVVNLVNSILIEGIRRGASDIHLDSFSDEVMVRYRIDGALRRAMSLRPEQFAAVASRIKIMANLNIMERRLPQDGRLTVTMNDEKLDMRVSIVPIARGESLVLRILGRKGSLYSFSDLGLHDALRKDLLKAVKSPHGLFLVTGPTGSGKTTTLTALLREIYSEERKIVSIEDPVEYLIDGVDQIQTNERIGLTFDSVLRRVLRQDPDIILVGEIRDGATAELAVRAALTGHLVLATLHTNDALSAVPRLTDMGVPSYLVAAVLRGALSQRLVRNICVDCRESYAPHASETELLVRRGFSVDKLFRGRGCENCGGTGFKGRTAISELFTVDEELERMIARGEELGGLRAALAKRNFQSLMQDGFLRALAGVTTLSEVEAAGF